MLAVLIPIAAAIGRFWVTARTVNPKDVRCSSRKAMDSTASAKTMMASRL